MITLMTLLAISCKKEDTTTTFADEIKDYYIAIENAGNGFGLIYFKYHGSVLYAHYQDVKNDVNFANNSEGFKISGDSSITIVVDSKNTILLNFKRNTFQYFLIAKGFGDVIGSDHVSVDGCLGTKVSSACADYHFSRRILIPPPPGPSSNFASSQLGARKVGRTLLEKP